MRIIAGSKRGQVIDAPAGMNTRPTTDRVRESLMSSIISRKGSFEALCVLDAFAGSGALAFESLSRGAAHATLCDISREALSCIKRNATRLGYDARSASVLRLDVLRDCARLSTSSFDIAYFDPPYRLDARVVVNLIQVLFSKGILKPDALAVYEFSTVSEKDLCALLENTPLRLDAYKAFGATRCAFLVYDTHAECDTHADCDTHAERN